MEQTIVLTLARDDAEALASCLRRRAEKLCDIRKEICEPDAADAIEREERAFFDQETELVERILASLDDKLRAA